MSITFSILISVDRGGIGRATAIALARRGCSIAVHYNSAKEKAETLVSELTKLHGVKASAFQADMSNYEEVRKLHAQVVQDMGHPQILFNNAGLTNSVIGPQGDIQAVSVEEFEATWKVNTGSSYLVRVNGLFSRCMRTHVSSKLTQLCLPNMVENKYGRVVFCSRYV